MFSFYINSFFITIGFSHIFLLGIFVRHLPNFPGTVFSFFHVTSFHFFPHIFVGQHGFHISPCSYFLFPCYFLSLFFKYLLLNMDFIFSLAHLRFSSHQEKYPTSNSSSSRQVNNIWYQISLTSFIMVVGGANFIQILRSMWDCKVPMFFHCRIETSLCENLRSQLNTSQVRHRQGGAALLGRGATDREVNP